MKPVFVFIALFSSLATLALGQTTQVKSFAKLNWLEGMWNRTNITKPGRSGHERWVRIGDSELRGNGVTLQGADTLIWEKITIIIKENDIFYVADVPENQQPVYFKFTEITESGFVCENPDHDFPKKISYQLEGDNLKAQISGNGKAIDYWFERK